MSCVYPIDAWRATEVNESGKHGIVFNPRNGFIDLPLSLPCGKCIGCFRDKAIAWGVRCFHEASLHERNCFITLTYRDDCCPVSIDRRDVQLFIKRLRKLSKCRYFACGEYGTRTRRPHYHALLFGVDFLGGAYQINDQLWSNPFVDRVWGKGLVSIGRLELANCMYVAGYCNKKLGDQDTFSLMSRRPGIGHTWLDRYGDDLVRTGRVIIEGQSYSIPRTYYNWYHDLEIVKEKHTGFMRDRSPEEVWRASSALRGLEITYKSDLARKAEFI